MDFIVGLPLSTQKSAHCIMVHTNYKAEKYAELYIAHIMCLYGVPKTIISDLGPQFTARFWVQLHASLGRI
jgi:hypothetical protein